MTDSFEPLTKFTRKGADLDSVRAAHIAVMARYEAAGIPSEYFGITLDNSPVREAQGAVYEALDKYVGTFTEDIRHKNLYLFSRSPGTGKSTTALAILHDWIRMRFLYHVKSGEQVPETLALFMDVTEFQNRYNLSTMTRNEDGLNRIANEIERYSTVPFLVVDDLGVRGATEAFRGYLHTIMNARVTSGLPTVYTSNEPLESIRTVFDDRLYDRVRDQTLEIAFRGESHRGRRTK